MIIKKEIDAITDDDFTEFLKKENKYDDYLNHILHCIKCGKIITGDNIAAIVYKENEYKFICDNQNCLEDIQGGI